MEQVIIDGVDIFNPMSKKDLDLIIDSFVQYFGEDKRRVITKRLKNTLYLFTGSEDPYGEICTQDRVSGYIIDKIKSLQAEFLGIDIEGDMFAETDKLAELFKDKNFDISQLSKSQIEFLHKLTQNSNEEFKNIDDFTQFLKQNINEYKSKIAQLYVEYKSNFKEEYQSLLGTKNRIDQICGESNLALRKCFENVSKQKRDFVLDSIKITKLIDLDKVSEDDIPIEFLANELFSVKQSQETIQDAKKFFSKIGISSFNFNKAIKDFKENPVVVQELKPKVLEFINKERATWIKKSVFVQDCFDFFRTNKLNIPDEESRRNIINFVVNSTSQNGMTDVFEGFFFQSKPVCILREQLELNDKTLIHEMTHAVSSDIKFNILGKWGRFGVTSNEFYGQDEFQEILTERIAQEVYKIAKGKGLSIGKNSFHTSRYIRSLPVLEPFFKEYEQDLKKGLIVGAPDFFAKRFEKSISDINVYLTQFSVDSDDKIDEYTQKVEMAVIEQREKDSEKSVNNNKKLCKATEKER